ncbi:MAG TPA: serine/threonine-protein kinase [Actinocatenispora sp.]
MIEQLGPGDPRRVGPYELVGRLGRGGMGRVFLGRSVGGRLVAVKVVAAELSGDVEFRRRFGLEVAAARQVGGFYTAQVVDANVDADPPWLVTAYIPGPSLQEAVEAYGRLPAEAVRVLGSGLAEGLSAIHACGLVHRDLKPGNVILADDGPRVIDFGIARALDAVQQSVAVIGTPGFMSPEQARGLEVGPAADVFSFGCVLAFALTGRGPYGEGRPEAILYRVIHEQPDLAGLPPQLDPLVRACLSRNPGERPAVADVLGGLAVPAATTQWLPAGIGAMVTERRTATRVMPGQPMSGAPASPGAPTVPGPAAPGWGSPRPAAPGPAAQGFAAPGAAGRDGLVARVRRRMPGGLGGFAAAACAVVAAVVVTLVVTLPGSGNGSGQGGQHSAGTGTHSATPAASTDPCDVIDNSIISSQQLVDTGTGGGYEEGSVTVTTCTWASGGFGDSDFTYKLAYASADVRLVSGATKQSVDLSGIPSAVAYGKGDDPGYTGADAPSCQVSWPTSFGYAIVVASISAYTGIMCRSAADFAQAVYPKVPK